MSSRPGSSGVAAEPAGLGLSLDVDRRPVIGASASPTADEAVEVAVEPGPRRVRAVRGVARQRRPEDLQRRQAAGQGAAPRRASRSTGSRSTRIVAGWLLRPSFPDKTLADLVDRYLDEKLPEADPDQLVPETRARRPAHRVAWFTLPRRRRAARRARRELARGAHRHRAADPAVLADMELRGVTVDARRARRALRRARRSAPTRSPQQAYAEIGREVNLGSPKQLQEVLFDELRHAEDPHDEDRLLDGCRRRSPTCRTRTRIRSSDLLLQHRDATKLRQIIESLDKAIGADGRIHTTYVQTGSQHRPHLLTDPNLQNIPVRTEEGRRIRSAFQARRGIRDAAHRRLLADRDAHHGAPVRGPRADRGVQRGRGPAPLRRRARLRRRPGRCDARRCAPRSRRCRTASPTASAPSASPSSCASSRPRRKQLMTEYFDAVRRGARLPARRRRAGEDRRLHRDDLRPPSSVPRPRPAPTACCARTPSAPRSTRRSRARAADIMKIAHGRHRRRHRRAGARARRMLLQVHDELVFEVAPGESDAARSGRPRRAWRDAADLAVPLDVQIGRGANWDDAAH